MLDLTALWLGRMADSAALRYGKNRAGGEAAKSAASRRPVVVWNTTRTCNLKCVHCYSDSDPRKYAGELTTEEAKAFLSDLADFGSPAVLFSGGEPLLREDLLPLADFAARIGLRVTLSTNGTLITEDRAKQISAAGFCYVGISLDGGEETHDRFRRQEGAFRLALQGIRNLKRVGQKVGLRFTMTRYNIADLPEIFRLVEEEEIDRVCFYHLVPTGRGYSVSALAPQQERTALDKILDWLDSMERRGLKKEVLTVDNHCDGPYLYLKMLSRDPAAAEKMRELLAWNGGGLYSSGVGIGCVDFLGNVHPDQFWMHHTIGNIRQRPFSEIWKDGSDPLLAGLRDRRGRIHGRCASCRFFEMCGGAMRVRAERLTGDPWASDPACYLSEEEISGAIPV